MTPPENGDTKDAKQEVLGFLSKLIAAAVSVTAVAAMGGAVAWARFDASELPASQAVALIGRTELIATGAYALLGFVVAGLVALACAYALDKDGTTGSHSVHGLIVIVALEVAVATALTLEGWERWVGTAAPIAALLLLAFMPKGDTRRTEGTSFEGWMRYRGLWPSGRDPSARWALSAVAFLLVVPLIVVAVLGTILDAGNNWFPLVYLAVAVGLAWVTYKIARATETQFLWYGVTVFLTVVAFGAAISLMRTYYAPKLQPVVAVLEFQNEKKTALAEMSGIYVGEADNRLYIGLVDAVRPDDEGEPSEGSDANPVVRGRGSIFWVNCDQVVTYGIGSPVRVDTAIFEGVKVVGEDLDRQPITETKNIPAGKTTTVTEGETTTVTVEPAETPPGTCKDD